MEPHSLQPGAGSTKKRPTLAQIAEAAGVSIATVSKVINQRDDIAQATRERIERVIVDMGYVAPDVMHAFRRKKRKNTIQMVAGFLSDYEIEILRGVNDTLLETNVRFTVTTTYGDEGLQQRWANEALEGATDGLIFIDHAPLLEELLAQQMPFAIVDHDGTYTADIPSVTATNWTGGHMAVQHLIELGHRRIGIITGKKDHPTSRMRLAGYRAALEEAGIPLDPSLIRPGNYITQTGYEQTHILLDEPEPPTAIFACNDQQAAGVYQALYERHLSIPGDISVVGFDDIPFTTLMTPPLTTVRQPLREMGRVAVNMVLRLMSGQKLDSARVELPTTLMQRASCAPPPQRS